MFSPNNSSARKSGLEEYKKQKAVKRVYGREREEGNTVYRERERLGTVRVSREKERTEEKVYKA